MNILRHKPVLTQLSKAGCAALSRPTELYLLLTADRYITINTLSMTLRAMLTAARRRPSALVASPAW